MKTEYFVYGGVAAVGAVAAFFASRLLGGKQSSGSDGQYITTTPQVVYAGSTGTTTSTDTSSSGTSELSQLLTNDLMKAQLSADTTKAGYDNAEKLATIAANSAKDVASVNAGAVRDQALAGVIQGLTGNKGLIQQGFWGGSFATVASLKDGKLVVAADQTKSEFNGKYGMIRGVTDNVTGLLGGTGIGSGVASSLITAQ